VAAAHVGRLLGLLQPLQLFDGLAVVPAAMGEELGVVRAELQALQEPIQGRLVFGQQAQAMRLLSCSASAVRRIFAAEAASAFRERPLGPRRMFSMSASRL